MSAFDPKRTSKRLSEPFRIKDHALGFQSLGVVHSIIQRVLYQDIRGELDAT